VQRWHLRLRKNLQKMRRLLARLGVLLERLRELVLSSDLGVLDVELEGSDVPFQIKRKEMSKEIR